MEAPATASAEQKPLLDLETGAEEEWENVDERSADLPTITVQALIQQDPNNVLRNIKAGVIKLGEFEVEDTVLLAALGDRPMLTMGAASARIDFEAAWRRELGAAARAAGVRGGGGPLRVARKGALRGGSGWSRMVVAEAYVVRIRDAAAPDDAGLIRPLLRRWQARGVHWSVFGLPAVQAVLEFKWWSFGRRALLAELACFLVWLVSFTSFALLWQDEDPKMTLEQLLGTARGRVTVGAELLALGAMAPFMALEVSTLAAYTVTGWSNVWNILDVSTYTLQAAIAALHLNRITVWEGLLPSLMAAQCVLLFYRLNYFSRLFYNRFSFVDSLKQVLSDVRYYLAFLLLMVFGFSLSYYVLFTGDEVDKFSDIAHSFLTTLNFALSGINLSTMLDSPNPHAAMALSVVYQFSMSMIMMNILTGMMVSSMTRASQHEELKALLARAQVIDELEAAVPRWAERWLGCSRPPFVHVLRLDPKSLDTIESDQLWHRVRGTILRGNSFSTAGGGGGGDAALSNIQAELAALRAQVATLNELLHTAVPSLPPSPGGSE